ncbi:proline dehydrogenase family protein [Intrasporangium calvum]|uniref:proline dehydrogenase n=1 Tax=Intrasporangium calvum TaxID=53358 RepID=A0ABT5GJT5_9MICO|nr:proline dehydrogenase family protein [Intrasporangium calvum]MDC5698343.1 proline dehydrogenase family protein [Intrasporangium calvum]
MLGPALLAASRSPRVRHVVSTSPVSRSLVDRFVAGEAAPDALAAVRALAARGLLVTIDHLGEDTTERAQAEATRDAYVALLVRLADEGLAGSAEVSLKLSALGQALPGEGGRLALDNARAICEGAAAAGTTVTLDMEDHTTVDSTLSILAALRSDFPWVGAVVQSALFRTEADVRDLAHPGSRVRLVKGAYREPRTVAHVRKAEVDEAYRRCLAVLFAEGAYPMVASHDQTMIDEAIRLAALHGRGEDAYELQMLYGIRTAEQDRQVAAGRRMRVYLPYGQDWYGYFMRRLAERPANVGFFLRGLIAR